MQMVITASPRQVTAISNWEGYESGYAEVRYTTPTTGGGLVTLTLPEQLTGVGFESAHLSYVAAGASGTKTIRYNGTNIGVTDSNLLERLRAGEREIGIYFNFRATGGTGGLGPHSASYTWNTITLTINYVEGGGISGVTAAGGHTINYFCTASSLAPNETATMSLITDSAVTAAKLYIGRGVYESAVTDGIATFEMELTQEEIDAMLHRTESAHLRFTVTDGSGETSSPTIQNAFTLVKERLAPTVSVAFRDESGYDETFGGFVSGQSSLAATISAVLDTDADANIGVTDRTLVLGGVNYPAATADVSIGVRVENGTLTWSATVTDTYGMTGTATGSISLLAYSAPAFTALEVQRFSVAYDPEGEPVPVPDDGSPHVWLTLTGAVASVAGANAWQADIRFTGNGETITRYAILQGDDGGDIDVYRDTDLLDDVTLAVTAGWSVTLTVTDRFGVYTFNCPDLPKGGGLLNIEATGVAVGKRSEGTRANPLFEVAYPSVFTGDVEFRGGIGGSGEWVTPTLVNCTATATEPVKVKKLLGIVFLRGAIRLNSSLTSGSGSTGRVKIGTLPSGYRPTYRVEAAINIDTTNHYLRLWIEAETGDMYLENRCGSMTGTGIDIFLCCNFLIS